MKFVKFFGIAVIIVIIAVSVSLALQGDSFNYFVSETVPKVKEAVVDIAQESASSIIPAPPPLRAKDSAIGANLTRSGVILATNSERAKGGKSALVENKELNAAAMAKVDDMFKRQYFAHVSPSGTVAGDLAKAEGYVAISVGENLASGNFKGDAALVQAWMDSPGHRANILRGSFEEIGVAVKKGMFEGHETWLAVQIFGRPRSSCPETNKELAAEIVIKKEDITSYELKLGAKKSELDSADKSDREAYNQKVEEYNRLVAEYNQMIAELKGMVELYNQEVRVVNQCIEAVWAANG